MAPVRPTGGSYYALNLARTLPQVDDGHDYVIFARSHSVPYFDSIRHRAEVVDVGALPRLRRYIWEQASLPRELKQRGAILLHSPHYTTPLLSPCPRVITVHDMTFFLLPERFKATRRLPYQLATRVGTRLAKRVIVPSLSTANDLQRLLGTSGSRISVTYEGANAVFQPVDPSIAAGVAAKYGLPAGYLLSLGTQEPNKNRTAIIQALAQLTVSGRDLHLAVVGGGGWRTETEREEIEGLGLTSLIHYTGYVPEEDLPAIYSAASMFLFPSLHEGFGLAALEAMSCGVPVITSNTSSLPEVVGDAALLIDPRDPATLAAAIGRLIDEPGIAQHLRDAGPERAAHFSWEQCARETAAVYRQILGEPEP